MDNVLDHAPVSTCSSGQTAGHVQWNVKTMAAHTPAVIGAGAQPGLAAMRANAAPSMPI